jgi:membrane protein
MPTLKDMALAGGARLASLLQTLRRWPWFDTLRTLRLRFREDRLGLSAGSLTFTTLIALVPLLTVMLAMFTAFPMFSSFQGALEKYFLQALVPDSIARPVLRSLTQFASKASRVGSVGLLLLVATALSMMLTIDRTLNGIWRVRKAAADRTAHPGVLGRTDAGAAGHRRQPVRPATRCRLRAGWSAPCRVA